ncbi:MAG: MarR family winged helix-turn-helix transcriptional regulator [Cyanophyceae cyanobacterium]
MNLQLTNLMGAVAIAIADCIQNTAEETTGQSASFPAALVIIDRYPAITVDLLGQYLQLSQSGAARLVERLVDRKLVERHRGSDRRFVQLQLTSAGHAMVQKIQRAKFEAVFNLLKPLTAQEQQQLLSLLSKLAEQSQSKELAEEYICRFCDIQACPLSTCQEQVQAWRET